MRKATAKHPHINMSVNAQDCGMATFGSSELRAIAKVFLEAARALENDAHGEVICEHGDRLIASVGIDRGSEFPFSEETGLPLLRKVKF